MTGAGLPDTLILNVYNEISAAEESTWTVDRVLKNINLPDKAIVCGDFNAHHPWWNSKINHPIRADTLVDWIHQQNCDLLNTQDQHTYISHSQRSSSVLNLTFATAGLYQRVLDWHIDESAATGSDHEVILFKIATEHLQMVETPFGAPFNLQKADWKLFQNTLEAEEPVTSLLMSEAGTTDLNLEYKATLLRDLILKATDTAIPKRVYTARSKV